MEVPEEVCGKVCVAQCVKVCNRLVAQSIVARVIIAWAFLRKTPPQIAWKLSCFLDVWAELFHIGVLVVTSSKGALVEVCADVCMEIWRGARAQVCLKLCVELCSYWSLERRAERPVESSAERREERRVERRVDLRIELCVGARAGNCVGVSDETFFAQVCAGHSVQLRAEVRGEVGAEEDVANYGEVCLEDCVEVYVRAFAGSSGGGWQSKESRKSP